MGPDVAGPDVPGPDVPGPGTSGSAGTRLRLLSLLGVLALLVGALVVRSHGRGSTPATQAAQATRTAPDLAALRAGTALRACPSGVSPALPHLVLPCLGGGPAVALSGAPSGVPTLVNLYGSWCGPCAGEMPFLVGFSRLAGERVRLLGIDTEDEPAKALAFARDFGAHWPSVVDDDRAVLSRYGSGPPVTLFVAATGAITYVQVGGFRDVAAVRAAVAEHLGVRV